MEWVTTSTILRGLRDFDNAGAWEQFTGRFRRPLAAFAQRVGVRPNDVDDVVQETLLAFAEAHRKGTYHPDKGRLSSWLFGIAYRHAMRQLRKYGRHEVHLDTPTGGTSPIERLPDERHAGELWEQVWERHATRECLERLRTEVTPEAYEIFELAVLQELKADEVASKLGVEVRAVYNSKHRTLKRIRELRTALEQAE